MKRSQQRDNETVNREDNPKSRKRRKVTHREQVMRTKKQKRKLEESEQGR